MRTGLESLGDPNPPSPTPVFVRTSIGMEGGTVFHFIDASPADALKRAREAAGCKDVRIGGGPTTNRDFLAAGLVDHIHIVVVPILLGRGVRLWDDVEGLEKDYDVETTSSPGGVAHVTFARRQLRLAGVIVFLESRCALASKPTHQGAGKLGSKSYEVSSSQEIHCHRRS
jgi:dihydrofolate reductase